MVGGMCGGGHAWLGVCVAGGGGAWKGCAWGGGMHDRGCVWYGGVRGRRDGHCSGLVRILLECILLKTARK